MRLLSKLSYCFGAERLCLFLLLLFLFFGVFRYCSYVYTFSLYLRFECINEWCRFEFRPYKFHFNDILWVEKKKKKTELLKPCNRLCVPTQNTQCESLSLARSLALARAQLHYFSATAINHFSTAQHWNNSQKQRGKETHSRSMNLVIK